ncbi:MAG: hypothetical protein VB142_03525 [Burkholderia sp.]
MTTLAHVQIGQFITHSKLNRGRFVEHVPDKHFRMINFYGFLANRVRGQWPPKVYMLLGQTPEQVKTIRFRDLQNWAFGMDPLKCVWCGSPLRYAGITRGKSLA